MSVRGIGWYAGAFVALIAAAAALGFFALSFFSSLHAAVRLDRVLRGRRGVRRRRARSIAPAGRHGVNTRTRLVSLAALLVLVACTAGGGGRQGGDPTTAPSTGGPPAVAIPHVAPGGAPTLRAAIAKLCVPPGQTSGTATGSGSLPPDVVAIAHQVERARGHTYTHLPAGDGGLRSADGPPVAEELLVDLPAVRVRPAHGRVAHDRRDRPGRRPVPRVSGSFTTGQVVGYYDPETGELVYRSSGDLGFSERFTLAHELTHALDDQTFDLTRLDPLERALPRRTGRGSARARGGQRRSTSRRSRSPRTRRSTSPTCCRRWRSPRDSGNPPPGVPRFVFNQELWPYTAGESFVASLAAGGTAAVDHAFEHLPVSTEQIIDPSRYPSEPPTPVSIPDVAGDLGSRVGRPRRDDDRRAVAPRHAGAPRRRLDLTPRRDGPAAAIGHSATGATWWSSCARRGTSRTRPPRSPRRCRTGSPAGAPPPRWCTPATR